MTLFENVLVNGAHFAMVMEWKQNKMEPSYLQPLTTVQIPFATVPSWAAWEGIPPVVVDPISDVNPDANYVGTDLASLHLAHDNTYMYCQMTLHDGDSRTDTLYVVEFQQYLTQLHTPGDVIVMASYDGGAWHATVSARGPGMHWYYDATGVVGRTTKKIGWKLPLSVLEYPPDTPLPYYPLSPPHPQGIENRFLRVYIHPIPVPGEISPVADENDSLSRPLIVNFYPPSP